MRKSYCYIRLSAQISLIITPATYQRVTVSGFNFASHQGDIIFTGRNCCRVLNVIFYIRNRLFYVFLLNGFAVSVIFIFGIVCI
jgi:hypothetical protein